MNQQSHWLQILVWRVLRKFWNSSQFGQLDKEGRRGRGHTHNCSEAYCNVDSWRLRICMILKLPHLSSLLHPGAGHMNQGMKKGVGKRDKLRIEGMQKKRNEKAFSKATLIHNQWRTWEKVLINHMFSCLQDNSSLGMYNNEPQIAGFFQPSFSWCAGCSSSLHPHHYLPSAHPDHMKVKVRQWICGKVDRSISINASVWDREWV